MNSDAACGRALEGEVWLLVIGKSGEAGVANVALEKHESVEFPLGNVHLLQETFTKDGVVLRSADGDGRLGTNGKAVCLESFALDSPAVPISGAEERGIVVKLRVWVRGEADRHFFTIRFLRGASVSSRGRPEFALEGRVGLPLLCCPKVG